MKSYFNNLSPYQIFFVIFILALVSFFSSFYFFQDGQNLLYADAISRLNIARKVIDNITPGLPQLGNVWLPLPQMLMLPFIWNTFLWHSGIAGAIMSMSAFIIGGLYIYKAAKLLTNSFLASLFATLVYALNINILYLQTTAMSEALFLCTLSATIYYFLIFFKTNNKFHLIPAALAVSAMTLTRYEGLAILLSSIPLIFLYTWLKTKKYKKAEGNTILYGMLAFLGFGLWTLYLTVIFGDPLYWNHYYATAQATGTGEKVYTQAKPFMAAVWQYTTSTIWMVGIIPFIMGVLGIGVMLIKSIRDRTWYFLPLLLPLSVFLFMVLTLQRNTPIVQPPLTWDAIMSAKTSTATGFNIRYGLLLLPWFAIMSSYIFNVRFAVLKLLVFSVFAIQLFSYIQPTYTPIYRIPAKIDNKPFVGLIEWMKKNYDGGYIMVSASSQEDQMFQMGFDYKTYIHEGTNKYWKESLDDPPRYATWVILDKGKEIDPIATKQNIDTVLERDYNLVFQEEQVRVYKIKHKPYFMIN